MNESAIILSPKQHLARVDLLARLQAVLSVIDFSKTVGETLSGGAI